MKKGQSIIVCIFALSMCMVIGFFLGRNLPGRYDLPQKTNIAEPESASAAQTKDTATGGPLDLNAATHTQLTELPGIGDILAQRILDYRQSNGPFTAVDDLLEVEGIGAKKLEQLKPFVGIGG